MLTRTSLSGALRFSASAVLSLILAAGCMTSGADRPSPTAAVNTLSQSEKASGWRLLFDGKDLQGWRVYHKPNIPTQWQVQDGAIALTKGGAGDLMTSEEFSNFDLVLEWKISPKGNSGVIYFVKELDGAPNTYNTGLEMQVLDNDGHPDGKLPSHRAGALYDLVAPPDGVVRPVGEWNKVRILVKNGHIEQWLNGQLVVQASYGDDAWRAMVAKSKFKDMPFFGKASSGHIALQDHGDPVWYRNVKIKPL